MIHYVRTNICEEIRPILHKIGGEDTINLFGYGVFRYFSGFCGCRILTTSFVHWWHTRWLYKVLGQKALSVSSITSGSTLHLGPWEYALVLGLQFGESNYNPNADHGIPERGIFHRLFQVKHTTIGDMLTKF